MSDDGRNTGKKAWKAFQANYDFVFAASTRSCSYCLTDQQVSALMSMVEYLKWPTRWVKAAGEVDRQLIVDFADDLEDRLMSGCCGDEMPVQFRYDDDGNLERSIDGGHSFQPAPQYDPRNYSPQYPEPAGEDGDDKKCIASTGAAQLIKEQVGDQLTDEMTRYTLDQVIKDWLKTYLETSNPFQTLITIAANQIFALVIAVLRPALTEGVYDTLKCILYCNISDDASFTDSSWSQVRSDITEQIGGIAGIFLEHLVFLLGVVGLNNVARAGYAIEGDCSECACEEFCGSDWVANQGTIINIGDDFIEVEAANELGGYYATLTSPALDPENCCQITDFIVTSGVITDVACLWRNCGESGDTTGLYAGQECYVILRHSTAPFTVKFVFG